MTDLSNMSRRVTVEDAIANLKDKLGQEYAKPNSDRRDIETYILSIHALGGQYP